MRRLIGFCLVLGALVTSCFAASSVGVAHQSVKLNGVALEVVTVDVADPNMVVDVQLTDDTLGVIKPFSEITAETGAVAAMNVNFFDFYGKTKYPVGNVMSGGELLYGSAGTPNMAITPEGKLLFGMVGYFTEVTLIPNTVGQPSARLLTYQTNNLQQGPDTADLFTPAMGATATVTAAGRVYTVQNGVLTGYQAVNQGQTVAIPGDGYLIFHGESAVSYMTPADVDSYMGCKVDLSYKLKTEDGQTQSTFAGVVVENLVAGNGFLVRDGKCDMAKITYGAAGDSRWSTAQPRTAMGELANGKMVLVYAPSATLSALGQALVELGCVNAINTDGGGSTCLMANGETLVNSGRSLAVTVQVYDKRVDNVENVAPYDDTVWDFTPRYQWAAESLSTLGEAGMMRPNDAGGFDLEKVPGRLEAATMLVRMLGGEAEALRENYDHPFTDVADWANPYVGYLYEKELTTGIGNNLFGSNMATDANSYVTFLLRAIGYSDAKGDFSYDSAVDFAQNWHALTPPNTYYEWENRPFLRDDMAVLSYRALGIIVKGSWPRATLADQLIDQGAFAADEAKGVGLKVLTH